MNWDNGKDIIEFLQRIDEGYTPTKSEMMELSKIMNLDCSKIFDLTSIPKSINLLKNLQILDLDDTLISDINVLASIKTLKRLYISYTMVNEITPLSQLQNLQCLCAFAIPIKNIHALATLQNLRILYLSRNNVADISPLSVLNNLRELVLIDTKVSNVDVLSNLIQIKHLDLQGNQITNVDALSTLKNLKILNLSYTNIHTIPDWIGDLKSLQRLELREMDLHSIPQKLLQLKLPFIFNGSNFESGIHMYRTKLATQPTSLFMQPREMIEAYYNSEQVSINEAKVIFLGDGGVGKTYTIKRLNNGGKKGNYETETTPGVDITNYWAKTDEKQFNINFWDFGGQEIMHAMHRCFLTERTCYVVILSNRADGDLTARARYWLKNIQSFAPGARVLLAVNK